MQCVIHVFPPNFTQATIYDIMRPVRYLTYSSAPHCNAQQYCTALYYTAISSFHPTEIVPFLGHPKVFVIIYLHMSNLIKVTVKQNKFH